MKTNHTVYPNADNFTLKAVVKEFREKGFNVTEKALAHNYHAWLNDLKSGYLDEENGYFLFTPCGCNPLSFYAERLMPPGAIKPYQKTYKC